MNIKELFELIYKKEDVNKYMLEFEKIKEKTVKYIESVKDFSFSQNSINAIRLGLIRSSDDFASLERSFRQRFWLQNESYTQEKIEQWANIFEQYVAGDSSFGIFCESNYYNLEKTVKDIVIDYDGHKYNFGDMKIRICLEKTGHISAWASGNVFDKRDNSYRQREKYIHPHVEQRGNGFGYICMGDHGERFSILCKKMDIGSAFDLLEQLLRSYNKTSPYLAIENWQAPMVKCMETGAYLPQEECIRIGAGGWIKKSLAVKTQPGDMLCAPGLAVDGLNGVKFYKNSDQVVYSKSLKIYLHRGLDNIRATINGDYIPMKHEDTRAVIINDSVKWYNDTWAKNNKNKFKHLTGVDYVQNQA
jgi:hypothetical protein